MLLVYCLPQLFRPLRARSVALSRATTLPTPSVVLDAIRAFYTFRPSAEACSAFA